MSQFIKASLVIMAMSLSLGCANNNQQPLAEIDQANELFPNWQDYENQYFKFSYPSAWTIQIKTMADNSLSRLILKSSSKEIALGGALPSDYYIDEENKRMNENKYAESYISFVVSAYAKPDQFNWQSFFQSVDETVEEYSPYTSISGAEAVVADKSGNVSLGNPRVFVAGNKYVYELALVYNGYKKTDAERMFSEFLNHFIWQ